MQVEFNDEGQAVPILNATELKSLKRTQGMMDLLSPSFPVLKEADGLRRFILDCEKAAKPEPPSK